MWLKNTKKHIQDPTKCTYLISYSQLNLEGSYARNELKKWEKLEKLIKKHFFRAVRKCNEAEKLKLSKSTFKPSNKCAYQILTRSVWKKDNFCSFDPSAPPLPNWGITEFWPKFITSHIYLSYHQIESINGIWAILVGIEQSKWF